MEPNSPKGDSVEPLNFSQATANARVLIRRQIFADSMSCQTSHDIFRANIERANALLVVPGYSFLLGGFWQNSTDAAVNEVVEEDPFKGSNDARIQMIGEQAEANFRKTMSDPENSRLELAVKMTINLESLGKNTILHSALDLTMKSVIIQVWTAFEILAEQLLMRCIDGHPQCFPQLVHAASAKFRFRRLESAQSAYRTAFSDVAINEVLNSTEVKACAIFRHLLVHCGGLVDRKFLDQCAQYPVVSLFSKSKLKDRVHVDGEMVSALIDPVIHLGFQLNQLVYNWIQAHKPAKR